MSQVSIAHIAIILSGIFVYWIIGITRIGLEIQSLRITLPEVNLAIKPLSIPFRIVFFNNLLLKNYLNSKFSKANFYAFVLFMFTLSILLARYIITIKDRSMLPEFLLLITNNTIFVLTIALYMRVIILLRNSKVLAT